MPGALPHEAGKGQPGRAADYSVGLAEGFLCFGFFLLTSFVSAELRRTGPPPRLSPGFSPRCAFKAEVPARSSPVASMLLHLGGTGDLINPCGMIKPGL